VRLYRSTLTIARNGSGTYTLPTNSFNPAVLNTTIDQDDWNETADDIETALTESISRDGQTTTTQRIPFAAGISTDTVAEKTSNTGVTVDGVLLKDNGITASGTVALSGAVTISSTDAGATEAPTLTIYRNSASPADSDVLGGIAFDGEDSAGNQQTYARVRAVISDEGSTSEDGVLVARTVVAGTEADRVHIGAGVTVGATNDDKGAGTVNAGAYYQDGLLTTQIAQEVNNQTGAMDTGTTTIALDDSLPQQSTEGKKFLEQAITPKSATSTLIIDVVVNVASSAATTIIAALHQDATENALAVGAVRAGEADQVYQIKLRHKMTSGTTSATTFKVHIGPGSAATVTFNGRTGARLFGGGYASSITIREMLP
jgi:hypothetical protein